MEDEKSKFSEAEMVIGGLFALGLDGLSIAIDITLVGLAISPVLQSFAIFGISRWARSKNPNAPVKMGVEIGKYVSNLLPIVPTVTAIFLITAIIQNKSADFPSVSQNQMQTPKLPVK